MQGTYIEIKKTTGYFNSMSNLSHCVLSQLREVLRTETHKFTASPRLNCYSNPKSKRPSSGDKIC